MSNVDQPKELSEAKGQSNPYDGLIETLYPLFLRLRNDPAIEMYFKSPDGKTISQEGVLMVSGASMYELETRGIMGSFDVNNGENNLLLFRMPNGDTRVAWVNHREFYLLRCLTDKFLLVWDKNTAFRLGFSNSARPGEAMCKEMTALSQKLALQIGSGVLVKQRWEENKLRSLQLEFECLLQKQNVPTEVNGSSTAARPSSLEREKHHFRDIINEALPDGLLPYFTGKYGKANNQQLAAFINKKFPEDREWCNYDFFSTIGLGYYIVRKDQAERLTVEEQRRELLVRWARGLNGQTPPLRGKIQNVVISEPNVGMHVVELHGLKPPRSTGRGDAYLFLRVVLDANARLVLIPIHINYLLHTVDVMLRANMLGRELTPKEVKAVTKVTLLTEQILQAARDFNRILEDAFPEQTTQLFTIMDYGIRGKEVVVNRLFFDETPFEP